MSKIARGKLAKVVVFKGIGNKEKTASGQSRSDLMKNKRNKIVSKKQNAHGKKAFKFISSWTSAVISARKELGIKGFCAINGARRSTSSWCARASCLHGVQTDQQLACVGETMTDLGVVGSSFHMCSENGHLAVNEANNTLQSLSKQEGKVLPTRRIWIGRRKDISKKTKEDSCMALDTCTMTEVDAAADYGGACSMTSDGAAYGGSCRMTLADPAADYGGVCSMTSDGAAYGGSCRMTLADPAADYGGVCSMTSDGAALGGSCRMTLADPAADYGGVCSMTSDGAALGGSCSMTRLDEEASLPVAALDHGCTCSMTSVDGVSSSMTTSNPMEEHNMVNFLAVGTEMLWNEVKGMGASHLFGKKWRNYMQQKLFVLDFVYHVFCPACLEGSGDLDMQSGKMKAFIFETMVERISEEVQIRYFLQQQGLQQEEQKETALPDCASGSTEDVPRDTGKVAEAVKEKEDAEVAIGTLHEEKENLPFGYSGQIDEREEEDNGRPNYLGNEDVCWRSDDHIPPAWAEADDEDWIINKRFNKDKKSISQSFYPRPDGRRDAEQGGGIFADVTNKSLRGGMNRFEALAEDDQDDGNEDCEHCSKSEDWSDDNDDEELDSSTMTVESGKSYYAEYFQRKAEMRGGAGGANTTKNKQLTNALDALATVMKQLDATQEEDDSAENVVGKIAKIAKQWQEKTPTKGEMRNELQRLHKLLEKDVRQRVDPSASREAQSDQQQSFYGDFVRKLKETNDGKDKEWTTKGKGKGGKAGKAKGKGKPATNMQRFDLQKIWPQKDISTSQILGRELESGKEPSGTVVAVESLEQMAQFQSLAKAHQLKKVVTLVTKANDDEPTSIANADTVWLPYLSNLALVKAVVATTTGVKAEVKGMEPIKNKKSASMHDDAVTLRIVVDLWLIEEERARDYLRSHPHASLHHIMKKTQCQEIKTHGWVTGPDLLSGYCTLGAKDAVIVLSHSGKGGVFTSRLRQDVAQQPPVTWVRIEEKEGRHAVLPKGAATC